MLRSNPKSVIIYSSAKTKGYVSFLLYVHLLGAIIMLAKLSPAIFDYLDIFILSLEVERVKEWQTLQDRCLYLQILPTDASVMLVFH